MITIAMMAKGRTRRVAIATATILFLVGMLAVALPAMAVKKPPTTETWTLRLPGGYGSTRQTFIKTFPELTASGFHYYNPSISTQQGAPSISLTINLESVSAKTTDYVFYENWHLAAKGVDVSIGVPVLGDIRLARIACKELIADVNLWPPTDADPVFGTLKAKLRGEVLLAVPNAPGSPIPGYYYEGPELAIEWTFVEPRYIIETPASLEIPQGSGRSAEVTVALQEAGITGPVGLGFECKDEWGRGISAEFGERSQSPPFDVQMKVHVEPWVPTGGHTAYVIVSDWTSGRNFVSNAMTIIVTPSGFTVWVEENNPYELSTPIPKETKSDKLKVEVTPWTDYSVGMGLYWRPAPGYDFTDIGIELGAGDIPPPPFETWMVIHVGPNANTGTHVAEICVFDGGLGREFVCHVTFEVVEP